jgi:hypothetical protein
MKLNFKSEKKNEKSELASLVMIREIFLQHFRLRLASQMSEHGKVFIAGADAKMRRNSCA